MDRDLTKRHLLGVIGAIGGSALTTLPSATGGSHDGPWPSVLALLLGLGLAEFLLSSPVLYGLLILWARIIRSLPSLDQGAVRCGGVLFALSFAAAATVIGIVATTVMLVDVLNDSVSWVAAWDRLVLLPEHIQPICVGAAIWAILPRVVLGQRAGRLSVERARPVGAT